MLRTPTRGVRVSELYRPVVIRGRSRRRIVPAAFPFAAVLLPKVLRVGVARHFVDGEGVFLLAARVAVFLVFVIEVVITHDETTAQVGKTEEAALRGVLEKAREFDPFGHAGFDPTGIIRLPP